MLDSPERILNLHAMFESADAGLWIPQTWMCMRDPSGADWARMTRTLQYLRDRLGAPLEWEGADTPQERYWRYAPAAAGGAHTWELPGMWREVSNLFWQDPEREAKDTAMQMSALRDDAWTRTQGLFTQLGADDFRMRVFRLLRCQKELPEAGMRHFGHIAFALYQRKPLRFEDPAAGGPGGRRARVVAVHALNLHHGHWTLDVQEQVSGGALAPLQAVSMERLVGADFLDHGTVAQVEDAVLRAHQDAVYGAVPEASPGPAGERTGALLRFTPLAARWAADEHWHPDQHLHFLPDGDMVMRVPDTARAPLLLSLEEHMLDVSVLAPDALDRAFLQRVNAAFRTSQAPRKATQGTTQKKKGRRTAG